MNNLLREFEGLFFMVLLMFIAVFAVGYAAFKVIEALTEMLIRGIAYMVRHE